MKLRTAASIVLIIFAIGMTFHLFVRPVISNKLDIVVDSELNYLGNDDKGEGAYVVIKREMNEWLKIICQLAPLLSIFLAYFLRHPRKGN